MALRLERLAPAPEIAEPLMAAIARERAAALRARRGLSAAAPRARLNAIVRRLEDGLERARARGDRRRRRAHLPAGAAARRLALRAASQRRYTLFAPASSICVTSSRLSPARGPRR